MSDASYAPRDTPTPAPRRRWGRWLLSGALIVTVGGAAYSLGTGAFRTAPTGASTSATPVGPRRVKALGEVLPQSDILTIAAPTGPDVGRIVRITAHEGDAVTKGAVLALLDTEPTLQAQLDQAIANEAVQRTALAATSADLDASEGQLSAQVGQQTAALEKAQVTLDRLATLRDSGLYQDTALAESRLDVESATYTLQSLQVQLDRNRLRAQDGRRIDEARALAELQSAVAARTKAEADYANTSIRAPIDGRILAVNGRIGAQLGSDGFGLIADTGRMKVRAEVYESDVAGVEVGQTVTVTSRAIDADLKGSVSRIGIRVADQSILSTDPAAIVDARVIEVWIALDTRSSKTVENLSGLQVVVTFDPKGQGDAER